MAFVLQAVTCKTSGINKIPDTLVERYDMEMEGEGAWSLVQGSQGMRGEILDGVPTHRRSQSHTRRTI